MKLPRRWFIAMRCAARLDDAIMSATASACVRLRRRLLNARRVNSPGSAIRHPAWHRVLSSSRCIHSEPCTDISTVSSPVYERGLRYMVATPWSSGLLSVSSIVPRCALWVCAVARFVPCHILVTCCMACGPLMRATAMPPVPCGVDMAQMVSVVIVF